MSIPLVFIHGYSDSAEGFKQWRDVLTKKRNLEPSRVHLINYISLANEVGIGDIAEGLDLALAKDAGIQADEPFDAIVHSTGMLVIRAWLTRYASLDSKAKDDARIKRLRHLVAIAPATNGSPVAHKGRSWLGALVKGSKDFGPDFLESGHQILSALELGSSFTWNLAEKDMFGTNNDARFMAGEDTPYVFTFCGDSGLGAVADLATGAVGTKIQGSDGVVRWAGAALNSRRLLIDYTGEKSSVNAKAGASNIQASAWNNQDNILILWPGLNHGTIMKPKEADPLVMLVSSALDVTTADDFKAWNEQAKAMANQARKNGKAPDQWQQLVIRVVDERGDGVEDWTMSLKKKLKNKTGYKAVQIDDLHPYEKDKSYRCLHINLTECQLDSPEQIAKIEALEMQLSMNTNSDYLLYLAQRLNGQTSEKKKVMGLSELSVNLTPYLDPPKGEFKLLMPYTTTFVEFRVNRNPSLDDNDKVKVCHVQAIR